MKKIYFVKAVLPNHELEVRRTGTGIQIQSPPAAPASSHPALPTVTAPSPSTQETPPPSASADNTPETANLTSRDYR